MNQTKDNPHYIKNVLQLIRYTWKFAPELLIFRTLLIALHVAEEILIHVSLIRIVVDSISQRSSFANTAQYILFCGGFLVILQLLENIFQHYVNTLGKLKIHKGVHTLIFQKVQQVDLENYDNTKFYNDYIWALEKSDSEIIGSLENLCKLIMQFANAITMLSITLIYDRLLLIFAIFPILVVFIVGSYVSKLQYRYEQEINPIEREKNYTRRIFYLKDYAKELKLYRVGTILLSNFKKSVEQQMTIYKKYGFRFVWTGVLTESANSIFGLILLCLYMAYRAIVQGAYSAGTAASMINAINNMSYAVSQVFAILPKLQKNGLFAEKILSIIHYDSKIEGTDSNMPIGNTLGELTLEHVSFAYPGNGKNTLQDISFSLKPGEKVAIVGMNGAGKTTLIKLIMHYYDVQDGTISYNGVDIRDYATSDYRKKFATIFQDFQIYAIRLEENVAMESIDEDQRPAVRTALEKSQLSHMTDQLSSNMTKEFDENGINLSGGQMQKVAIARALYRNSDIVIMDEASSALDPISEAEINQTIMEQFSDKSMIIISHRLSTIKHVDTIYFMEGGQITERGSHEELMKLNGGYAHMYTVQAEQYCTP